jgi:transposase
VYKQARVLLLADEAHKDGAKSDKRIAELVDIATPTVERVWRRFAQEGLQAALGENPRLGRAKKFTAKQRAEITALACSDPPKDAHVGRFAY